MDYGFKDRVEKVFGSISSSSWSVTDSQVERREWNRDDETRDDDQIPVFSSSSSNDWDIPSSIGLDPTLGNEEEEDAYDKMAQGMENCGHRLYMKDITHHGPYLGSHNVLHDPRANHDAARTRLKEDDDAAAAAAAAAVQASDEPMLNAQASEIRIKSILKRKSYDEAARPAKRVRFDSTCKNADATHQEGFNLTRRVSEEDKPGVPDYILNPSKYTRYSFDDSSHNNNNNNTEAAYLSSEEDASELPKSVVFIPRKKSGCEEVNKQSSTQACRAICIAALEEGAISEEDDVFTKARCQKKPVRQYRSKHDDVS